jgi:hypothetical protein
MRLCPILTRHTNSSATVKARKKEKLSWSSFSDEGRVLTDFVEEYQMPEDYVQLQFDLKNASHSYTVPRWYKQRNYVDVATISGNYYNQPSIKTD